jgi:hypothetical protein
MNVNLYGHTCMQEFGVSIQVPFYMVRNKKEIDFNLNFKLNQVHTPQFTVDTCEGTIEIL